MTAQEKAVTTGNQVFILEKKSFIFTDRSSE